jgi:hypothetical protein
VVYSVARELLAGTLVTAVQVQQQQLLHFADVLVALLP